MRYEDLPYLINPTVHLSSPYLQVVWSRIDQPLLEHEGAFHYNNREAFILQKRICLLRETSPAVLRLYYSDQTDFARLSVQNWLRRQIKTFVEQTAAISLPRRLHELEAQKGLFCKKVTVRTLRRNILGYCTFTGEIALSPTLVLFPRRMSDAIILHEIAHLRYPHHRKSFWTFLSTLLEENADEEKFKCDIAYCEYRDMIEFLMK